MFLHFCMEIVAKGCEATGGDIKSNESSRRVECNCCHCIV